MSGNIIFRNRIISKRNATRETSTYFEIFKDSKTKRIRYLDNLNQSKSLVGSTFGNTYFVSPDGNDTEAERGNIVDPFKTISAAMDQAWEEGHADSLVYVFPGTYPENELSYGTDAAPGRLYLSPGATIQPHATVNGDSVAAGMIDASIADKTFTFEGNFVNHLNNDLKQNRFRVLNGANAGRWTLVKAAAVGGHTVVTVQETPFSDNPASSVLSTTMFMFLVTVTGDTYLNTSRPPSSNFAVYGKGNIILGESLDGDWEGFVIYMQEGGGTFTGEFDKIKIGQGACIWQVGGTSIIDANELEVTTDGYCMTCREDSVATVRINRLVQNNSTAFFIRPTVNAPGYSFTGSVTIFLDRLETTGAVNPFNIYRMGVGGHININCPYIQTDSQYAFSIGRAVGGQIFINGDIVCDTGGGGILTYENTGCDIVMHGNMYLNGEGANSGIAMGGGSNNDNTLTVQGNINIINGVATPAAGIKMYTGSLRMNGTINNITGAATGAGIIIAGAAEVIGDTVKIVCDNAESVLANPSQARDININHNLAATTSLSGDITNIGGGSLTVNANVK